MKRRSSLKALVVVLLFLGLLGPAAAAWADWILDADAGLVYESNIGFALLQRDTKGDIALTTSFGRAILKQFVVISDEIPAAPPTLVAV